MSPPADTDAKDDTTLIVHTGTGCRDGAEVLLYELRGGGHTWPRGEVYAHKALVGRVSAELDATAEIWRFFIPARTQTDQALTTQRLITFSRT